MAKQRDLWVHSDSNKNIGLFLMFLGGVVCLPLPALLKALDRFPTPWWTWRIGGAALLGVGLLIRHLSRKRFRIEPGKLTVQDRLLSSPVHYRWQGAADIHLSSYETKDGENWAVDLVCGKLYYRVHHCLGHVTENLSLAVALARAIGGSLVHTADGQPVVIPSDELELPFRERVQRHPQLLPPEMAKPTICNVTLLEEAGQDTFRWQLTWPHIGPYLMMLAFLMTVLAGAPSLSTGETGQSAFSLAYQGHSYTYFLLCGTILGGLLLVALGFRKDLVVGREWLSTSSSIWGMRIGRDCIAATEVNDIWVRGVSNGAQVQFVSEGHCLGGQVSNLQVARWVASRVARSLAA